MEEQNDMTKVVNLRQKKNKKRNLIIIAVVVVALAAGAYYMYSHRNFSRYVIENSVDRKDEGSIEYVSFQSGLIKYGKDGISFIDAQGKAVWTEAFAMSAPKAVVADEYIAFGDVGGNDVYLFNSDSKIKNIRTQYPITDVEVSNLGSIAVILEDSKTNYIEIYDKTGKKCIELKTSINKSGYPLDFALSEDGQKMVVSYVKMEEGQAKNVLSFYNFGDVGQNEVDRLVGGKTFDDITFPEVRFLDNDTVCAFGNKETILYKMKEKPSKITSIKYKEQIQNIFYNKEYFGFLSRVETGSKSSSKKETPKCNYTLKAFNLSGKQLMNIGIDKDYTKVRSNENEIALISNSYCAVYDYSGKQRFYSTFQSGVSDMIPLAEANRYVLITSNSTDIIRLR